MLLLLLLLISCNTCSSLGFGSNNNNNITVGQSISGNQTLISRGGMFELGFFTPGNTPSDNYYLGIWYKNISIRTIVWVANRDNPVTYPCKLELSEDGFLVVSDFVFGFDESDYNIPWNARLAVLLDDGNLVLWSGSDSSSSSIVWQSFDHSTDTWLPGAKLASESRITSWRYADDPAEGEFSLQADTDGSLVLQEDPADDPAGGDSYWTWHCNEDTSLNKYIKFNFVPVYNYVTYSVHNTSVPTRLVIGLLGRLQLLMWSESLMKWNLIIVQWDFCQENSWRQYRMRNCECLKGFQQWPVGRLRSRLSPYVCERKPTLCGYGDFEKDTFYVMTSIPLVENSFSIQDVKNVHECKRSCLKKCNCVAFVYTNSCLIWYGNLATLRQVSPNNDTGNYFYVRVAQSKKQKRSIATVVVIAVMGTVILLCTVLSVIWKCRWRIFFNNNNAAAPVDSLLVSFRYRDLKNATKNFSQELGRGGFGSVFKGTMPDSTAIAVKKLECFAAGEKQFRSEVATIGVIQHVNVIRLRGFCAEGSKRLLVYDYMPNGSLNSYLFQTDSKVLDWKIRYQIILGIARGLEYLHDKCRDCIIHCDIKPENVLLDVEFKPMVADFGLAKLLGRDFSRVLTTMRGTRGYLAPEWISGVPITTKADVYSYGMMLFEIISGRRNLDMVDEDMVDYFPARAASKANKGEEVISLLDKRLEGTADIDELTRACRVACWCIQDDENDRPSMGQIVGILEGHSEVGLPPVPSFLQVILHDPATTKHSILPSTVVGSDISFPSQDESINSCASSAV